MASTVPVSTQSVFRNLIAGTVWFGWKLEPQLYIREVRLSLVAVPPLAGYFITQVRAGMGCVDVVSTQQMGELPIQLVSNSGATDWIVVNQYPMPLVIPVERGVASHVQCLIVEVQSDTAGFCVATIHVDRAKPRKLISISV